VKATLVHFADGLRFARAIVPQGVVSKLIDPGGLCPGTPIWTSPAHARWWHCIGRRLRSRRKSDLRWCRPHVFGEHRRINGGKRLTPLGRFTAEGHESFRRGDKIAGSQRRIIFHAQWNQAKRIFTVTGAVCHLFLAVEERGFELGIALTVFGVGGSNLAPEKELGVAVRTDRLACIFHCPIDDLPNAEMLPIAQAYTEASGAADAAIATHSLSRPGAGVVTRPAVGGGASGAGVDR